MKLISWNVNGLRAVIRKEALQPVLDMGADIVCFQETKLNADTLPELDQTQYPYHAFHHAEKKGYSGTGVLSKHKPLSVTYGFMVSQHEHPQEGRLITMEFPKFFLVNVYTPNSKAELARLPYRQNAWDVDYRAHLVELAKTKPVIACGDLNVAHEEIDIANPKTNRLSAGFSDEEREGFTKLMDAGFVDTFRHLHPGEPKHYSWWSFRANSRARNVGWRIDYFLASEGLKDSIQDAKIHPEIMGSDHCPVSLDIKL